MPPFARLTLPLISASYLYPFKGIYFFLTHRSFWPLFGRRLLPLIAVSILVFGVLFTFAYLPQVAFLAIFHGAAAFLNALFLVLGEGAVIIALLFEALMVDETLVDVFDAVLLTEGFEDLVAPTRTLDPTARNAVLSLGKPVVPVIYSPFSFLQILEFIFFLPLNLIPYIGTPAFILITGARAGPFAHYRYFKLRNLNKKDKTREIRGRRWQYTWFGSVALLLQLVPVLSMFFLLTSAAGSALWAAQLERRRRAVVDGVAQGLLDDAAVAPLDRVDLEEEEAQEGAPPPYSDSPQ